MTPTTAAARHPATVIWSDAQGGGRNAFTRFRRRFALDAVPAQAELTLFGDTRYRLTVNGAVVHYGPARFSPAHPEADPIDIAPWLSVGANEILVEVNQRGAPSFEHAASSGGFIAWGKAGSHDLATPGAWECQRSEAWDDQAMVVSFAQGPLENCDTRKLDEAVWGKPVARDRQDAWGAFQKRSIPLLEMGETAPIRRVGAYVIAPEWRFGFTVVGPVTGKGGKRRAAYVFCIHTEKAQEVPIALFWGPHFLNGVELACRTHPTLGNRQDATLALKAGWNLMYGEPEVMIEGWGVLFSLPTDRGLTVSATPRLDDANLLRHGVSEREGDIATKRGKIPVSVDAIPDLGWTLVARSAPAPAPSHHPGWDRPESPLALPPEQLTDLTIPVGTHCVVFDVGHEFLGHVRVTIDAPAGTVVGVTTNERLRADGMAYQFGSMWLINETDRFIAKGGKQTWEGFNPRGGRWVQITVRGATAPVQLECVTVRETIYPFRPVGSFTSSDPFFDWIWRTGAATLRACSEDVFIDCPSRERGLYTYDAVVEHRVALAMSADARLFRRCLWVYATNAREDGLFQDVAPAHKPVTLADFSLLWVIGLEDYVRRANDRAFIDLMWPYLTKLMASPLWIRDGEGLINSDRIAIEHPDAIVLDRHPGTVGNVNALWCAALECSAKLATASGRTDEAKRFAAAAASTIAALRKRLWLEAEGCFASSIDAGKTAGDPFRATVYILAFGLANAEQTTRSLAYIDMRIAEQLAKGQEPLLNPNDSHMVLLACARNQRADLTERWIHQTYASNLKAGAWTLWEHRSPNSSLCHAWSAAPVWWLTEETLGASWDAASPNQVTLAPLSATLNWAAGTVPHPAGPLRVSWGLHGHQLHVSVAAPAGVTVTCKPKGRLAGYALVFNPS